MIATATGVSIQQEQAPVREKNRLCRAALFKLPDVPGRGEGKLAKLKPILTVTSESGAEDSGAKSASVQVAKLLNLNARDKVGFAELIHHVNDVPTAVGRHYVNTRKFPGILKEISQKAPSVPDAFRRIGVPDYARRSTLVEVRQPTAQEALILEIPPAQPVLELLGQNVAASGAPVEVTEAIVRADTVKLQIEDHQVGNLV